MSNSEGKAFEVTAVSDYGAVGLKDVATGAAYVAEDCWLEYSECWVGKTLYHVDDLGHHELRDVNGARAALLSRPPRPVVPPLDRDRALTGNAFTHDGQRVDPGSVSPLPDERARFRQELIDDLRTSAPEKSPEEVEQIADATMAHLDRTAADWWQKIVTSPQYQASEVTAKMADLFGLKLGQVRDAEPDTGRWVEDHGVWRLGVLALGRDEDTGEWELCAERVTADDLRKAADIIDANGEPDGESHEAAMGAFGLHPFGFSAEAWKRVEDAFAVSKTATELAFKLADRGIALEDGAPDAE